MPDQNAQVRTSYDISIVRPQLNHDDFKMRGRDMETPRLNAIKRGLRTLHTLELMAITIYRFQITGEKSELNHQLIAAMCNEMTHYQDFQVKLYEYGFKPSLIRWSYWIVGFTFGFGSRIIGKKAILKMGIWVETKAVHHYAQLLDSIDWDEDTRKVVEKNQADEYGHINRWKEFLGLTDKEKSKTT
ncbi:MAG: demethoxyubiquinone hydroxylase family protein [Sedimentisphaerales bacterium]|nr:demethoxyubiquinone hydroxylase family protein [Sedimentisphaerales bacterium]